MKFKLWPFSHSRSRQDPLKKVLVQARFIRTDSLSKGDLRLYSPLSRMGRAQDNDLLFDNDSVSSHHAEIHHLPSGAFRICDLNSTNGTWVNGEQIRDRVLNSGDIVELGEVRLHFRMDDGV